jgi:hypothetical protein
MRAQQQYPQQRVGGLAPAVAEVCLFEGGLEVGDERAGHGGGGLHDVVVRGRVEDGGEANGFLDGCGGVVGVREGVGEKAVVDVGAFDADVALLEVRERVDADLLEAARNGNM